tara:strand:- start:117 stop:554 length:438 start_codon:yes stop_codon:yes gene_type:complete
MPDTFHEDIKIGEEAEYMLLSKIKKKYPKAYKQKGEDKRFDIVVPEKNIKIEVKRDIGSNEYPNYFIEFECNGKDSGILATKSDFWVIFDNYKWLWIKVDVLRELSYLYGKFWEGIPKGGASVVKAFRVEKKWIRKHATRIYNEV